MSGRCDPGAPGGTEPVAELQAVVKRFRAAVALDRVSLAVGAGEAVALLGPNGAGKTTALSLLLGLRRPDDGEAWLHGRRPHDPEARRTLGVTPQATAFPPTLRVAEIAQLVARHFPSPERVPVLLGRFGLDALARRQAGGLSGGEARRLALALAFAGRPRTVVLDEPTAQLDIEARRLAWAGIRSFVDDGGTLVLTSHDLDEVEQLAGRVVALARGRVVIEGSVAEVRALTGLTRIELAAAPRVLPPGVVDALPHGTGVALIVRDAAPVIEALVATGADLAGLQVRPAGLEEALLRALGAPSVRVQRREDPA